MDLNSMTSETEGNSVILLDCSKLGRAKTGLLTYRFLLNRRADTDLAYLDVKYGTPNSNKWTNEELDEQIVRPAKLVPMERNEIVLDQSWLLTKNLWDYLLKTLEEPGTETTFYIVVDKHTQVPSTVEGRSFRRLNVEDLIVGVLEEQEKFFEQNPKLIEEAKIIYLLGSVPEAFNKALKLEEENGVLTLNPKNISLQNVPLIVERMVLLNTGKEAQYAKLNPGDKNVVKRGFKNLVALWGTLAEDDFLSGKTSADAYEKQLNVLNKATVFIDSGATPYSVLVNVKGTF